MIRRYKALSVAIMAMAAFSAFMAHVASATPLTSETATTFLTGDGDTTPTHFKTETGQTVTCNTTSYLAKATGGTSINELTVAPTYSVCTAFGFATAHVKVNGCTFTFTTPSTRIKAGEVTWHPADVHLVCPAEKRIEITPTSFGVSVCTQFIAPQTPTGGHVVGTNVGSAGTGMDVTLDIKLAKIHYTGTGEPCGKAGTTFEDATLEGNSTVKCFSDEAHKVQVGCTFS